MNHVGSTGGNKSPENEPAAPPAHSGSTQIPVPDLQFGTFPTGKIPLPAGHDYPVASIFPNIRCFFDRTVF